MYKSHMLFLVYGASGSGKSTILQMINGLSSHISIHKKDTSRKPRPKEIGKILPELRFKKKMNPKDYVLMYEQFGNTYGIRKDELAKALDEQSLHFIIIGDITQQKKMKRIFPYAVTIYIHYSPEDIPKNFLERDPLDYTKRKEKIKKQYTDYLKNNTFFDHVILNFWDLKNSRLQVKNIISLYNKKFKFDSE